MRKVVFFISLALFILFSYIVEKNEQSQRNLTRSEGWQRFGSGPVFRDFIANENYEAASDPHVFYDGERLLMIYTGDHNGRPSIKLAIGESLHKWQKSSVLLGDSSASDLDANKETPFYRKTSDGRHQIFYIGYQNESSYESQLFLAEADAVDGPYLRDEKPIVAKGQIAGKDVYCITSPSVVEHDGSLYLVFLGWNAPPDKVSEVWVFGAVSKDEGRSWKDFQIVETPIGMEGQVTRIKENAFVAVRTGKHGDEEAIFYSTASHPFGPWSEMKMPILKQAGSPYETNEIIAPQITLDITNGEEILYYTGAEHAKGWWIMMARRIKPGPKGKE